MRRIVLGPQPGQAGEVEALGLDLVEQPAQLRGQAGRLVLARRLDPARDLFGACPGENEPAQQKLAAQRGHGRRQLAAEALARKAFLAAQNQLVGIDIPQGHEPRQ